MKISSKLARLLMPQKVVAPEVIPPTPPDQFTSSTQNENTENIKANEQVLHEYQWLADWQDWISKRIQILLARN